MKRILLVLATVFVLNIGVVSAANNPAPAGIVDYAATLLSTVAQYTPDQTALLKRLTDLAQSIPGSATVGQFIAPLQQFIVQHPVGVTAGVATCMILYLLRKNRQLQKSGNAMEDLIQMKLAAANKTLLSSDQKRRQIKNFRRGGMNVVPAGEEFHPDALVKESRGWRSLFGLWR